MADTPITPDPYLLHSPCWAGFDWLVEGFSTRRGGSSTVYRASPQGAAELNLGFTAEDDRESVLANREALARTCGARPAQLITLRQTHSNIVHVIETAENSSRATGDGMMTNRPGLLLAIQTADCVPVLIADREHRAVAAFHAGWRGTVQRIVEIGVARMHAEYGSRPEQLSAAIGPCIGACCYTVGEEVRSAFAAHFSYAQALLLEGEAGALHLDLVEANRRQLLAAGIAPGSIYALSQCTGCHADQFFSYRKSKGRTGRMMSVMGIAE